MSKEEKEQRKLHKDERKELSKMGSSKKVPHPRRVKNRRTEIVNFVPKRGRLTAPPPPIKPQVPFTSFLRNLNEVKEGANANPILRFTDTGAFRSRKIQTGLPWVDCVLNGVPSDRDSRYPDPFTLANTSVTVVSNTLSNTSMATSSSSSSASYDYTDYGVFRGSPIGSLLQTGHPSDNSWKCDWLASDGTWHNAGAASSDFITRPMGCTLDILPRFVGAVHTAKLYAVPILPISASMLTSKDVTGWPTNPNEGLSAVQVAWGGREWEIDSTSKGIRLCSLPIDSRCLDFSVGNLDRDNYGSTSKMAWSTWIWWFSGLGQSDRIDYVMNCTEEVMPVNFGKGTQFAYPASPKRSDSAVRDASVNQLKALTDGGYNAYSWMDTAIDVAKKAWGIGTKIAPYVVGMFSGNSGMAPLPPEFEAHLSQKGEAFIHIEEVTASSAKSSSSSSSIRR